MKMYKYTVRQSLLGSSFKSGDKDYIGVDKLLDMLRERVEDDRNPKQPTIQIKYFCEKCSTQCVIKFKLARYNHTDGSPIWHAFATCPNYKWWNNFIVGHDKDLPVDEEGYPLYIYG